MYISNIVSNKNLSNQNIDLIYKDNDFVNINNDNDLVNKENELMIKKKNDGSQIFRNFLMSHKFYSDLKNISFNINKINNLYSYLNYLSNHLEIISKPKSQAEIVLARYNENIYWIQNNLQFFTIYNKGKSIDLNNPYLNNFIQLSTYSLRNVGRESHTYLYHIINNWDNLADVTLFSQGVLSSNHKPFPLSLYLLPKNENITINLYLKGTKLDSNKRIIHTGKYNYNLLNNFMRPAKLNFIDWWNRYIKLPFPGENNILWSHGAIFSVNSKLIKSHSKEYYQDLLSCIDDHPDPEEGHYFERAWFYIFNLGIINI